MIAQIGQRALDFLLAPHQRGFSNFQYQGARIDAGLCDDFQHLLVKIVAPELHRRYVDGHHEVGAQDMEFSQLMAGIAQRPATHEGHQSRVFNNRDELVWPDPAKRAVIPSHQRLRTNDPALHVELGLVLHIELPLLDAVMDGSLDGEVNIDLARCKYGDAIFATILGKMHRCVGIF